MRSEFYAPCWILLAALCCFSQSDSTGDTTVTATNQRYPFECRSLDTEPSNAKITVNGDSIYFRLFYVDMACSNYEYGFSRDEKLLIIKRSSENDLDCDEEEQRMYGVEGSVIEIPEGKYILQLESEYMGAKGILFRQAIQVN
ncbi:MAG: hypothetical protein GF350_04580 [Chitinivibrionales bacterium]|nr:hypothetical protein [Chitinivibrionales bacterium]